MLLQTQNFEDLAHQCHWKTTKRITCKVRNHEWGSLKALSVLANNKLIYYVATSESGQDETNPVPWLATWAGKMGLSCPLGTTRCVPQEKFPRKPYNKSFIDQACSVKMTGYWPCSFFASLWTETESRSINSTPSRSIDTQKKNETNIQPSWPNKLGQ